MNATLIFKGRHGAGAVCGLMLLMSVILLLLAGKDQARAEEEGMLEFFSILPGKPQLNSSGLGGLRALGR